MEGGNVVVDDMVTILEPLRTAITTSITPQQIVAVLAGVVGVGMTFFLMWFGVRKIRDAFVSAVRSGKIKI